MLVAGRMLAALRGRHHPSVPKPADLGVVPASTFKRMLNPSEEVSRRRFVTHRSFEIPKERASRRRALPHRA